LVEAGGRLTRKGEYSCNLKNSESVKWWLKLKGDFIRRNITLFRRRNITLSEKVNLNP